MGTEETRKPGSARQRWEAKRNDWTARWARYRRRFLPARVRDVYEVATLPVAALFLFTTHRIHPAYRLTRRRALLLGWRMHRTTRHVRTGMSVRAHLAMAAKLLEIPPEVEGDVVECGCFRGGTTANLSLICDLVGRNLVVYDSFEGLPAPTEGDRYANPATEGFLRAEVDEVRENVRAYGVIDRVTFRKGWFKDTLPHHDTPVVLAFLDVDLQASLHDCVLHLWPHVTEKGFVFIDEFVFTDYCALFWSEWWWRKHFDTTPPGMIGSGSGVGVGHFYLGPFDERPFIQAPHTVAYTRKDFHGHWDFDPVPDSSGNGNGHISAATTGAS